MAYSTAQKQAQRDAFTTMRAELDAAAQAGAATYPIAPGVHRMTSSLDVEHAQNFTIEAAGVELSAEGCNHFRLIGNSNVSVQGPLVLDADPPAYAQLG